MEGRAKDFTPLLAAQLDALGSALGLDLASVGQTEVATAGGRRTDIVAQDADGAEFVIENQYGKADHDHLTHGFAYAVAANAKGLIVVAEEHRDEFWAVAWYLKNLAELDAERGIPVWLVQVQAVHIAETPWAPLSSVVVEPNDVTATVEQTKQAQGRLASLDDFYTRLPDGETASAAKVVLDGRIGSGHKTLLGPDHVVLKAEGPTVTGIRSVIALTHTAACWCRSVRMGASTRAWPLRRSRRRSSAPVPTDCSASRARSAKHAPHRAGSLRRLHRSCWSSASRSPTRTPQHWHSLPTAVAAEHRQSSTHPVGPGAVPHTHPSVRQ
jgi:hypothetical protein